SAGFQIALAELSELLRPSKPGERVKATSNGKGRHWGGLSTEQPCVCLGALYVFCLKTFWTGLQLELYFKTLIEGPIAVHLNRGKVNEDIFSRGPLDKPISFSGVEPL